MLKDSTFCFNSVNIRLSVKVSNDFLCFGGFTLGVLRIYVLLECIEAYTPKVAEIMSLIV